jgi:ribosomal protein S18 acetylase RimI-like enzyme
VVASREPGVARITAVVEKEPEPDLFVVRDPLAGTPEEHVLNHAAWTSLTGPHAHFAEWKGRVARYPSDVSPFVAAPPDLDDQVWSDLAELTGPGRVTALMGRSEPPPKGWEVVSQGHGVQMIATGLRAEDDREAVRLGSADVPEMLDLVGRTKPGPFLPRTVEMGHYLGLRRDGALVAMAGERLHPPGWTEISAVCTDPAYRGQGLATRLVRAVAAGISERGERPLLHAAATNVGAIRLYQSIGFTLRRHTVTLRVRWAGPPAATPRTHRDAGRGRTDRR